MTAAPRHAADAAAPAAADTIALGDTIRFRGADWVVTAFHGPRLFLDVAEPAEPGEPAEPLIILQTAVTSAPDFAVLNRAAPRSRLPGRLGEFHALPRDVRKAAEKWERHVKEVLHQQAPNVPATTPPKPAFDPARRTLRQRYQAKADQLTQAGARVSAATVERKCAAWRKEGLMGLVDKRHLRTATSHGRVDGRVVDIVWEILDDERARGLSPGTLSRLIDRVEQTIRARYAHLLADPKTARGLVNSPATFYRLLERLGITAENAHTAAARHAAGSAISSARPGARRATWARWPGELVQIDTTGLDVLVLGDDGRVISVELTIAVCVATRSIVGTLIVPKRFGRTGGTGRWLAGRATRSFDTMQVVAQTIAPLPARPGWAPETFMEGSDLPFEDLLAADPRFAGAAARPVIKPETLVVDHGSPFISADFTRACHSLGIEVREARLRTAADKAIVERAMRAVKTGFSQYLASYTHHRLDLRGKRVRKQPLWTIAELQELFEQWVVLHWQQTPHGALRSPFTPGLRLTPNQMYAALVSLRGYPVHCSGRAGEPQTAAGGVGAGQPQGLPDQQPHLQPRPGKAGPLPRVLRDHSPAGPVGSPLLPRPPRGCLAVQPPGRTGHRPMDRGAVHPPPAAERPVDRGDLGRGPAHPPRRRRQPPRRGRHHPRHRQAAAHRRRWPAGRPRGQAGSPRGCAVPSGSAGAGRALRRRHAAFGSGLRPPVPVPRPPGGGSLRHVRVRPGRGPEP
ncbi:hypothetical protein [Streptomyces brasiliscabiei]|uniref:Integrase catalytic domain-containing protein n=1 Tax=Streptomyces brasiliscabiei TaxID=2736302 RepID=A0ABU8G410_9ACTN